MQTMKAEKRFLPTYWPLSLHKKVLYLSFCNVENNNSSIESKEFKKAIATSLKKSEKSSNYYFVFISGIFRNSKSAKKNHP